MAEETGAGEGFESIIRFVLIAVVTLLLAYGCFRIIGALFVR